MFSVATTLEFVEGGDVGKVETVVDDIGSLALLLVVTVIEGMEAAVEA